ncbi:hypothetical protein HGA64_01620 [Candidatus Falkowbacteria bacterium]|nr:hypothetical protein [Candidatus Falkowbacteria bacterium]
MPFTTEEEIKRAMKHKTPNDELTTPPGYSRMILPDRPSLPLRDNNNSALEQIAISLKGTVEFVPDKK